GAVIGEAEDAITPAQHRARQAALLFEGDTLRSQYDAIEQAEVRKDAWDVKRLENRVRRERPRGCRKTGNRARISNRQRKLEQGRICAEPVRVGWALGEIRAGLPPQIGAGQNAGIDLVTE